MKRSDTMALFRPLAALLAIALAGCATTPAQTAAPSWYVMRHLQKADGPDPGLSEIGRANADRLVSWFAKDPPKAIYVSSTKRARETAAPLAARLGLTLHDYDPRDTAGL